jgi:hypothetical protein
VSVLCARPPAIALLLIAIAAGLHLRGTVDSDVAWQLWIGRQLNHGARLYRDIIDTNPPLWFWMAKPVDWLSALAHVRSDHLLIVIMACAAALAIVTTDRLITWRTRPARAAFLAYASLVLVAMPWMEVGQREHIALIGALPYAALIACRRLDRPVGRGFALAIGAGAALGFALKHYFLLVPLLLEFWLVVARKKKWRPVRPETAGMAIVGIGYGLAILIAARAYLTDVVPVLLLAYGATGAKRLADLFQPSVLTALASIVLLLSKPKFLRSDPSALSPALTIAAIGFTAVYFVQAKGWSYHAVPMLGCAALALGASITTGMKPPRALVLVAPALLCLPFTIEAQLALRQSQLDRDAASAVDGMRVGDRVAFIAADPSFGWHEILQRGLRFSLRYNGFWMMQAVVRNELLGNPNPRLTELGRRVVGQTVADLECAPPQRIIVKRPVPAAARAGKFDILAFFMRDARFSSVLSHYRPVERTNVEVLEIQSALKPPHSCPRWSPA